MTTPTTPPTPVPPMTTREVADKIGTDPKTLRRFLRDPSSTYVAVGQGGRYGFTAKDMPTLKKRFAAWAKKVAAARTSKSAASVAANVDQA